MATDQDREGEVIAWHLIDILEKEKVLDGIKIERIVFNEITKKAIMDSIQNPRELSYDLINAQFARRSIDYLFGMGISPLLWGIGIRKGSAGRVQSPALKMIIEREEEIRKFIPHLKKQDREGTEEEPLLDEERGHYLIDEKNRSIELTDDGYILVEDLLEQANMLGESDGLYSASNLKIMKFVQATLRANYLFQKNIHYLVRNNEVLLIDEHTGRTMPGRRMSEGVHQALECKENVPIQRESQTLASTTFQNFFRLFSNLSEKEKGSIKKAINNK